MFIYNVHTVYIPTFIIQNITVLNSGIIPIIFSSINIVFGLDDIQTNLMQYFKSNLRRHQGNIVHPNTNLSIIYI